MIQIGSVVDDRYEILKEIGRGGMSVVYLAMDNRLNKSLVVKDIRKRDNSNNELLMNSLVAEANMLKKLDHGALPKIYDIIESEGDIYVVMDYIEGESLKERLKRDKVIAPNLVIDWAKQLAEVLEYLHTRKPFPIIYRDMKPDNIMLTPEGKIKLIDFGIAREYKTESLTDTTNLGTKSYAAPEQISGKQTDARTDIYSLGVTLYHLITGKTLNDPPFEIRPIREWNQSFPEGLEHIVLKCTQSEPDNRYQSCAELLFDLENINKLTKGYKNKLRKKIAVFLVSVILCIGFTSTSVVGYQGMKDTKFQDYMKLISDADIYIINGDDVKAIEMLEKAITTVDKGRSEAYINLLDIYINNNDTDSGLSKIESYIGDKYGKVHKNDEVLFKVGMTYFDIKRDYVSALRYFQQVDTEVINDAKYYNTLAKTMSSLNIDYDNFTQELEEFDNFNASLPNDRKKVDNYLALANIYSSYKGQIPDANTKTIETINKAYEVLRLLENENFNLTFEEKFEQKLAQAYHSRGINSVDKTAAREDFEQAIEHYMNLLTMNIANPEDANIKIGTIYQEMGEYPQAIEKFVQTIEEYPESIDAHIKLANLLLDMEQGKADGERDYTRASEVYEEIGSLAGSGESEDYRKLERRMKNLGLLGGF